ncbi:MAG: dephospho-CoA kinase [Candidatus Omnitrophica bacterium]|nr:dephospho-CoA kinase [Candidatus Omnitrophota bacterium]
MVQELKPPKGKLILGLTGGFGSGKTTVSHFFEELGAEAVEADRLAHEAYLEVSPVAKQISGLFKDLKPVPGKGFDRRQIAEIVFQDEAKRKKLEAIIHPYVFQRMVEELEDSDHEVIVLDVPLLFETGLNRFCHKTVVVKAPDEVVKRRLLEKGFSEEEIKRRQKVQIPLEEKLKRADVVIDNSKTLQETRREVQQTWKKILPALKGAA